MGWIDFSLCKEQCAGYQSPGSGPSSFTNTLPRVALHQAINFRVSVSSSAKWVGWTKCFLWCQPLLTFPGLESRVHPGILGGLWAHRHPWDKGKDGRYFLWCSVPSILILTLMRISTFLSFFQNCPTHLTDLSDEECLRDWRSAFPKMEKTDGRQAVLYPWFNVSIWVGKRLFLYIPEIAYRRPIGAIPQASAWRPEPCYFKYE